MKKTNRLASLFLAMLMAFSLMAVTASAYDAQDGYAHDKECCEETIMPRKPAGRCPKCGEGAVFQEKAPETDHLGNTYRVFIYECPKCGVFEYHVW